MNIFNNYISKKKTKKNNFKKHICSPKKKKYTLKYSCFTPRLMRKLRRIWNKKNPNNKIKSEKNNYKGIWKELKNKMKDVCHNEACLLKSEFIKNDIPEYHWNKLFAPKKPKSWKNKPNEWLSNFDIRDVIKQWEKKYNDFYFIGPTPINYDTHVEGSCVEDELCKFNLKKIINKGINKVGVIFNLDKHNESGSHWVTVFLDIIKKKYIILIVMQEEYQKKLKHLLIM